jgi:hypothetical protein
MKRIAPFAVVLTIARVRFIVAAYFCHFCYMRYRDTVTELENRINAFDMRLATLEGHKSRELTHERREIDRATAAGSVPPDAV